MNFQDAFIDELNKLATTIRPEFPNTQYTTRYEREHAHSTARTPSPVPTNLSARYSTASGHTSFLEPKPRQNTVDVRARIHPKMSVKKGLP